MNKTKQLLLSASILLFSVNQLSAQIKTSSDTLELDSVVIKGSRYRQLPDVNGTIIYAGKHTFITSPDAGRANLGGNNARTLFAQVPGVNVWEMDGAGLQLNISTRGTDAHRSIETNIRQNGYNTNSDMFGYPEAHYNQPFQGIQEVQIVRGASALQFGSQFGGMVNFKMKDGDTSKVMAIESEQTIGSNGFFNSYNAIGGTSGKWRYYAYVSNRSGDGWRDDAAFDYRAYYGSLRYQFNPKGSLAVQFSRSEYRQQIAGGLTDALFAADNRQSTRFRNFFRPEINIPALLFNYNFNENTKLEVTSHVLFGERSSVQFIANSNIADTVNRTLNTYNPRQVDRDYYHGYTTEARLLHNYQLGKLQSTLSGGLRYFRETTERKQKGTGTAGTDFDLSLVKSYGIDLDLNTTNYAAFLENIFRISSKLSVTPGLRYEHIKTSMTGVINNATFPVNYQGKRDFVLFGTGIQYQVNAESQLYGNISQAYRPYIYANVTPADQLAVIDPDLKDTRGYSADLGYRGHISDVFNYNFNAFYVHYGNKVGNLTATNSNNVNYIYTTNIGDAVAKGIEAYTEVSVLRSFDKTAKSDVRLFSSLSYNHARYTSGSINQSGTNVSLKGHYMEGSPEWIERAGFIFLGKHVTSTIQYSYIGKNFSDANNTISNPTGASGIVPAYHVFDWSFNYRFMKHYHLTASINNIGDAKYFTRRISMYPGPGILPADGRTFNIGFGVNL